MPSSPSTVASLRRVFFDSFVARDLAEPLASFDITADVKEVHQFMVSRPLTVIGLRRSGIVDGFIQQENVNDLPLKEQMVDLSMATILATTAPLRDVVRCLNETPFVLVSTLGQPVGVIVRADLEKPPMRMWMFGMVTLFEMVLTRIVDQHHAGNAWCDSLSDARVAKARQLQAERHRRKQNVELIDCLQLSDKGQVLARSQDLRARYWNRSRNHIEKSIKEIESLRNNLAHAQAFTTENWSVIVQLAETTDQLLELPAEFVAQDSLQPYSE
ncbi:hypothetical protein [Novipirellula artificiosorum]|uniref:CBS domain-containing protein n=1 Tax=Novipirellula artificiosorum TaxID=2528016 RepID=A0A5C6D7T9_9BACT|nr:hypothetical protein [Novipirellula artificiosorum]TWU31777.1 hypothetical protein Poly41_60120 [Novipirellula artificiosorum]